MQILLEKSALNGHGADTISLNRIRKNRKEYLRLKEEARALVNERIEFFNELPDNLTYPLIQPFIFNKVLEILNLN